MQDTFTIKTITENVNGRKCYAEQYKTIYGVTLWRYGFYLRGLVYIDRSNLKTKPNLKRIYR